MQKADLFNQPVLLTLTIDRSRFSSPSDAFETITRGGYVRRLMRLLNVTRWAWALEFQMKTGDGWPHWHLVVDLPPARLDLKRAWRLWRDKWKLGGLDLQRKENKSAEHALLYITKYLTEYPYEGFPEWVLYHGRRIRWVGASGTIGRIVSDREMVEADAPDDTDAAESLPREHRPLAVRMADCGELVNFFREIDDGGATRLEFFGRLPREVVEAAERGRHGIAVQTDDALGRFMNGSWESFGNLAGHILMAASAQGNRLRNHWLLRERAMRQAAAVRITRGEEV